MLLSLEKHGIDKGYFIKKKIKNFDKAINEEIPNTDLEAIEFDKTKRHPNLSLDLKSADALIFNSSNKLSFMEFKTNIKNYMSNKKIRWKICDSFQVLKNIYTQIDFKYKNKKNIFHESNKKFIFLHNWNISSILFQFNLNKAGLDNIENNLIISLEDMNDY